MPTKPENATDSKVTNDETSTGASGKPEEDTSASQQTPATDQAAAPSAGTGASTEPSATTASAEATENQTVKPAPDETPEDPAPDIAVRGRADIAGATINTGYELAQYLARLDPGVFQQPPTTDRAVAAPSTGTTDNTASSTASDETPQQLAEFEQLVRILCIDDLNNLNLGDLKKRLAAPSADTTANAAPSTASDRTTAAAAAQQVTPGTTVRTGAGPLPTDFEDDDLYLSKEELEQKLAERAAAQQATPDTAGRARADTAAAPSTASDEKPGATVQQVAPGTTVRTGAGPLPTDFEDDDLYLSKEELEQKLAERTAAQQATPDTAGRNRANTAGNDDRTGGVEATIDNYGAPSDNDGVRHRPAVGINDVPGHTTDIRTDDDQATAHTTTFFTIDATPNFDFQWCPTGAMCWIAVAAVALVGVYAAMDHNHSFR